MGGQCWGASHVAGVSERERYWVSSGAPVLELGWKRGLGSCQRKLGLERGEGAGLTAMTPLANGFIIVHFFRM